MITVHHCNFGNIRHFETVAEAKSWTIKACFDAVIYAQDERVATFSSITGWHDVVEPIDDEFASFLDREEEMWMAQERQTEGGIHG